MSTENAKIFLEAVTKDETLKERLAGKDSAEVLAAAKEQGLECTLEELEEAGKSAELSPEEMSGAAGGTSSAVQKFYEEARKHCYNKSQGPLHDWVYTHHEEEPFHLFGFIPCGTIGYNYFRCSLCGATKKQHVKADS